MSEYEISWTTEVGYSEVTHTVAAPSQREALKMYSRMTGEKLCSCGENESCDMCPRQQGIDAEKVAKTFREHQKDSRGA